MDGQLDASLIDHPLKN